MKRYSIFHKVPGLEPHHHIVSAELRTLVSMGYYHSTEVKAYSTAQADRAACRLTRETIKEHLDKPFS